jgi:hypothetical protein
MIGQKLPLEHRQKINPQINQRRIPLVWSRSMVEV